MDSGGGGEVGEGPHVLADNGLDAVKTRSTFGRQQNHPPWRAKNGNDWARQSRDPQRPDCRQAYGTEDVRSKERIGAAKMVFERAQLMGPPCDARKTRPRRCPIRARRIL